MQDLSKVDSIEMKVAVRGD